MDADICAKQDFIRTFDERVGTVKKKLALD